MISTVSHLGTVRLKQLLSSSSLLAPKTKKYNLQLLHVPPRISLDFNQKNENYSTSVSISFPQPGPVRKQCIHMHPKSNDRTSSETA